MKLKKPNVVDPFPSPMWLVPHKHPDVFNRQVIGVRFRWPKLVGWVVLAASFVAAILLGWPWVPAIPFIFLAFWSGILTNKGKPLRGAVLLVTALFGVNIVIVGVTIVAALVLPQVVPPGG